MDIKAEIRQNLIGSMIIGRCEQEPAILFQKGHCSGTKCIRFSTDTINALLPTSAQKTGVWKTGRLLQYEVYNDGTALRFQLSLSSTGIRKNQEKALGNLLRSAQSDNKPDENGIIAVRSWNYPVGTKPHISTQILDSFFDYEMPYFESELRAWSDNQAYIIKQFPNTDILIEGSETNSLITQFERNKEARKKCIAHYGTACQICGFDFGNVYGPDFAGMIEVHHIVPLSEIRDDYIVDPIRDLIPVCSNCHTALHSRAEDVYRPEQLREMLNRSGCMVRSTVQKTND